MPLKFNRASELMSGLQEQVSSVMSPSVSLTASSPRGGVTQPPMEFL